MPVGAAADPSPLKDPDADADLGAKEPEIKTGSSSNEAHRSQTTSKPVENSVLSLSEESHMTSIYRR